MRQQILSFVVSNLLFDMINAGRSLEAVKSVYGKGMSTISRWL
ncbi:MAG: hypothetical protein AABX53_01565 [Nanoarchaeota archaeon]